MVRLFKKKSEDTTLTESENHPANVPSTSSLKARVEEAKARKLNSRINVVSTDVGLTSTGTSTSCTSIIRQIIIGLLAGSIIGVSVVGLGKFSVISVVVVLIIIYIVNRCGYIQINWNRVEEDEKILEEGITGETEQKKKKTLAKKVKDETTYLLSSNEEKREKQVGEIFGRFFERTFPFVASLLLGFAIGFGAGLVSFSKK